MAEATESDRIKQAFQVVDKLGKGCFARKDLAKVFQSLEDWSQADLDEMFDAVDTRKDGTIDYTSLVDWIMQDDDGGGDVNECADEDSDDDEAEHAAMMQVCADLKLDLKRRVSLKEWTRIVEHLDMDAAEAEAMYKAVEVEFHSLGRQTAKGLPLGEFLDDLEINEQDREGLSFVDAAVDRTLRGEVPQASSEHALNSAAGNVAVTLRRAGKPAEEAWDCLQQAGVASKAGKEAVLSSYNSNKGGFVQLVRQYMVAPPMLPCSAGQSANREDCTARVDEIVARCRATGVKFSDPDFDVIGSPNVCLYVDKEAPGYDCTVGKPAGWKRLSELVKKPAVFKGGVQSGDIKQGQIGTCFLLGALSAIAANKEESIKKAFIKYDIAAGVYGIRFCVNGEWSHVIIDDLMPVDAHGRLLFARSADPEELWAPLLEKAYCKLNTCYEMCDGGKPMQAVYHMCGGISGKFTITDDHKANPGNYFQLLRNARRSGWLLTSTFVVTQGAKKGDGKCGEAVLPTGLVGGHVYSVSRLVDVGGFKLVCCRNPWGTGEWKGKFSDANEQGEWTPEIVEKCEWSGKNDGKFWMTVDDFVQHSAGVEFARSFGPNWKKMTAVKTFQQGALTAVSQWAYQGKAKDELSFKKGDTLEVSTMNPGWWHGNVAGAPDVKGFFPGNYVKLIDRPVARFDLRGEPGAEAGGSMSIVMELSQPNVRFERKFYKRKQDGLNYKDVEFPSIRLIVVGADGKVVQQREGKQRSLSVNLDLKAEDRLKAYALSLDGRGIQFNVRVYAKDGTVTMTEVENAHITEVAFAITG